MNKGDRHAKLLREHLEDIEDAQREARDRWLAEEESWDWEDDLLVSEESWDWEDEDWNDPALVNPPPDVIR